MAAPPAAVTGTTVPPPVAAELVAAAHLSVPLLPDVRVHPEREPSAALR
ncbi:hypothetical protein ABZX75_15645 [Streptomyces sp. NPDC003038]